MFKIEKKVIGPVTAIVIEGRITFDEGTAEKFSETVRQVLDGGCRLLVLDLAEVQYADSMGLGELIHSHKRASRVGCELVLCGLTRKIRDFLSVTKLLTVFETYESQAAAVEALRNR